MTIKFTKRFAKQYNKAPQTIKKSFNSKLHIFQSDPFDSRLNNHKLAGELRIYRSINVTGDWRAIYREDEKNLIFFEFFGTHSQLYN